ncbi:Uu.00g042100.m01.CDS01 [Anthostomella pinea]|uniref:Uu.00g042100.m01.CDS01 n=1 Tax=Anthostomella pinea TaxID=933095 RepID=A0AAI8VB69_9PEZI|nr:Uu.00g042100.m01.CDS01 [Anthostomella pinea]
MGKTPEYHRLWTILTVLIFSPVSVLAQNYPLVPDSRCNCFRTNTTTSHYFKNHKFFDFRDLSQYARVPAPIVTAEGSAAAPVTNAYFEGPAWTSTWSIQTWNNSAQLGGSDSDGAATGSDASVLMVNSANNIYIQHNDDLNAKSNTYMVLRTVRHDSFQSAAEIDSVSADYQYLSIRMLARTRGAPGAITAMFTYHRADQQSQVQESDLEIRTSDPKSAIHYTNQPSYNASGAVPQATRNVSRPGALDWSQWHYHRMDWAPGSSSWFVDGQLVSSIQFQTPKDLSSVVFNAWSDGGTWSGNMSVNTTAEMQIQWIELVYNNTDTTNTTSPGAPARRGVTGFPAFPGQQLQNKPTNSSSCANVCSIDQTSKVGTPVLISQPQAADIPSSAQAPRSPAAAKVL